VKLRQDRDFEHDYSGYGTEYHDRIQAAISDLQKAIDVIETQRLVKVDDQGKPTDEGRLIARYVDRYRADRLQRHHTNFDKAVGAIETDDVGEHNEQVEEHLDKLTDNLQETAADADSLEELLGSAAQQSRDHRRTMNENIIKAIRNAYGWSPEGSDDANKGADGDTSKGQTKSLRRMLEDKEYFKTHYTRVHRERKADAAILLWNLTRRSAGEDALRDDDERHYVREEAAKGAVNPDTGKAKEPEDKDRKKILDKVYDGKAASDYISSLQVMRKNLIVVYLAMLKKSIATGNAIQDAWTYNDLKEVVTEELYSSVMHTAIEQRVGKRGILHFNSKQANVVGLGAADDARHVQDYAMSGEVVFIRDRDGKDGGGSPLSNHYTYEEGSGDLGHLGRGHFLKNSAKDGRAAAKKQLEILVKQRLPKRSRRPTRSRNRWRDAPLDAQTWQALLVEIESAIVESRAIIFDLDGTKYNKDDPNRFISAIESLGKGEKKVAKALADWEARRSLCRVLYERLQDPIPDGTSDTGASNPYVRQIVNSVGAVATSHVFRTEDKEALMRRLQHVVSGSALPFSDDLYPDLKTEDETDELVQRCLADHDLGIEGSSSLRTHKTVWHRWLMYRGDWMRWDATSGEIVDAVFAGTYVVMADGWREDHLAALDGIGITSLTDLRDLLIQILELELMELATLVQLAEGDVAARREVDWVHYSKEVLNTVRMAQGMVVYVDDLSNAYKVIRKLVKGIFGDLNHKSYSRVGDTTIAVVVALKAGGSETFGGVASVSCAASIGIQIAGKLSQADDRRVRFTGSFGINMNASAGASAKLDSLDGMSTEDGGDPDTGSTYKHAWISGKAELAVEKGLLSASSTSIYVDDRHLAAAWAHRLTMLYLHFTQPFRAIRHLPDKANRIKVVNPRTMDPLEEALLKHMVGDDYEKVLEYVQKDVATARSIWQGITNWDDVSIKADVAANLGGLGGKFHAERMVHKQTLTHFTKKGYAVRQAKKGDKTYDRAARVPHSRWVGKEAIGAEPGKKSKIKSHPVLTDTWGKSYPPTTSLSFSASQQSTAEDTTDSNIFDTIAGEDSDPTNTVDWEIGANFDTAPTIDVGFTNIEDHPNWDNDGWYLNIKASRSMGATYSGPVDVGFSATVTRPINPQKINHEFDKLRDLTERMTEELNSKVESLDDAVRVKDFLMSAPGGTVAKHLAPSRLFRWIHTRGYYKSLFWLSTYGTFELNLVYSNAGDKPGFVVQYGRITRGWSTEMGGSVPILPGLSVGITGSYNRNWAAFEVLGHDTMTYVKTIWDGFALRFPAPHKQEPEDDWYKKNAYWETYKEKHLHDLLELLTRVGWKVRRRGSRKSVDSNARAEVLEDEASSNSQLKTAAKNLREACEEQFNRLREFKEPDGKETLDALGQKTLALARVTANHARTAEPTGAYAVAVMNVVRGRASQPWPNRKGKLPAKDSRSAKRPLVLDVRDDHHLVVALINPAGIQTALVELVDANDAPLWSKDLVTGGVRQPELATGSEDETEDEGSEASGGEEESTSESSSSEEDVPTGEDGLPDLTDKMVEVDDETHVHFVADFKKSLSEKIGAELAQFPFPDDLKTQLEDPSKGPFKFRLRITENKDGVPCSSAESWTYVQIVDETLIEKLEVYLEASRKAAPQGQAARWEERKAGDPRPPFIVITDSDEEDSAEADADHTAQLLAEEDAPELDRNEAQNVENRVDDEDEEEEDDEITADSSKTRWRDVIRPNYAGIYGAANLPAQLVVDPSTAFDGDGGPNSVRIFQGVVDTQSAGLCTFAMYHETGHAVAAQKIRDMNMLPPEPNTGARKIQHEYFADLIAVDVMIRSDANALAELQASMDDLEAALGGGTNDHPSGTQRVAKMQQLIQNSGQLDAMITRIVQNPPHG
jgi:hypothetical protein